MPGKNPNEAFHNFYRPLQQNLSCISKDILVASRGGQSEIDKIHGLTLSNGPILISAEGVQLDIQLQYMIVKTDRTGKDSYRCSTRAYAYSLLSEYDHVLYAWHWHPFGNSSFAAPHVHPRAVDPRLVPEKAHFPSGRMSMEEIIRAVITEMRAPTERDDWDSVLALNQGKFELYRSWVNAQDAPGPDLPGELASK